MSKIIVLLLKGMDYFNDEIEYLSLEKSFFKGGNGNCEEKKADNVFVGLGDLSDVRIAQLIKSAFCSVCSSFLI